MGEALSETRGRRGLAGALLLLTAVLLVVIAVAVSLGAASISFSDLATDGTARAILMRIRVPRVLVGALVGATLAVAGLTFQTLLRNPLADPFILGVSGGAAAGAAVSTAFGLARIPGAVPALAFAGATGATAAVFLLARRRDHTDPTRLLLSGLVLNAFFSAVILICFSLSKSSDLTGALRWMMGTLFGTTWTEVALIGTMLALALVALTWFANDLRMIAFGEEDAKSHGVNVERVKLVGFVSASLITGAAVAVSGIIGFVGLLVPQIVRMLWRRDFRFLLPLCAAAGAILLVLADLVSRTVLSTAELPIGAFTALLGVPFFLSVMRRTR